MSSDESDLDELERDPSFVNDGPVSSFALPYGGKEALVPGYGSLMLCTSMSDDHLALIYEGHILAIGFTKLIISANQKSSFHIYLSQLIMGRGWKSMRISISLYVQIMKRLVTSRIIQKSMSEFLFSFYISWSQTRFSLVDVSITNAPEVIMPFY